MIVTTLLLQLLKRTMEPTSPVWEMPPLYGSMFLWFDGTGVED